MLLSIPADSIWFYILVSMWWEDWSLEREYWAPPDTVFGSFTGMLIETKTVGCSVL